MLSIICITIIITTDILHRKLNLLKPSIENKRHIWQLGIK